jgi:imidazolonepropionase-like amidohydrolase
MGRSLVATAALVMHAVVGQAADGLKPQDLVLVHAGTLLSIPGRPPLRQQTVVIAGGRVVAIRGGFATARDFPGSTSVEVVDMSDQFVLPGMIDLHVHLTTEVEAGDSLRAVRQDSAELALVARTHAMETLAAGFTTVLDLGTGHLAHEQAVRALRNAIQSGLLAGPRILIVGSPISATGGARTGHYLREVEAAVTPPSVCDGADDCRRAVREQVSRGADVINFYDSGSLNDAILAERSMTDAEMKAIVDTAHNLGRRVVADGHTALGINAALRAGADIIDTAPWPDAQSWLLLKSNHAFLEPHLQAFTVAGVGATGAVPADARVKEVLAKIPAAALAVQKGVPLAYGSDTGMVRHGNNAGDLAELTRIGLTAAQAIQVATINSAAAIGRSDDLGSLEPGKFADLIAVRGDPLQDIQVMQQISAVMREGRLVALPARIRPPSVLIIWAGRVFAAPDQAALRRQSLIVRDGRIERIADGYLTATDLGASATSVKVLDLSGQFVMPGMMDLHVHLSTEPTPSGAIEDVTWSDADFALRIAVNAQKTLNAGFTTVLDMGTGRRAHEHGIYAARAAARSGSLAGPDILAVGSPISAVGSSRTQRFRPEVDVAVGPQGACAGADDCRRAVREQVWRGADVINVYNTGSLLSPGSPAQPLTDEELRTIVDTAHSLQRKVVADGAGTEASAAGINAALTAGADWIDTAIYPDATTWRLVSAQHVAYVPHLFALVAAVGDGPERLSEGSMGWLPEELLVRLWTIKQQPPAAIQALHRKIPMALASDAGVFAHGLNASELLEYVKIGMTPAQALVSATSNPAELLGLLKDRGTIAVGKRADLIAVDGDPLADIRVMQTIHTVIRAGVIVKQ